MVTSFFQKLLMIKIFELVLISKILEIQIVKKKYQKIIQALMGESIVELLFIFWPSLFFGRLILVNYEFHL